MYIFKKYVIYVKYNIYIYKYNYMNIEYDM